MTSAAGPPAANDFPVPRNNPLPIVPAMAIMLICLVDNDLFKLLAVCSFWEDVRIRESSKSS